MQQPMGNTNLIIYCTGLNSRRTDVRVICRRACNQSCESITNTYSHNVRFVNHNHISWWTHARPCVSSMLHSKFISSFFS